MPISRKDENLLIGLLKVRLDDVSDRIRILPSRGISAMRILKVEGGSIAWVNKDTELYHLTSEQWSHLRPRGRGWKEKLVDILEVHTRKILDPEST